MSAMFETLVDLATGSSWTYAVVFAVAALDAVAPVVPSEALVVSAAALAASGRLELPAVLAAATAGAFVGDNAAYLIGRRFSEPLQRRLSATAKWRNRLSTARLQLRTRGPTIVVVSRFIPGGRTATMFAAGMLEMAWRRFARLDLAAAVIWALYGGTIGFFGGAAFEEEPLVGVALAVALALVLALLIEGSRRLLPRLPQRPGPGRGQCERKGDLRAEPQRELAR
jgi:membrane protein DedA with SNARE-associated domain